MEINLIPLLPAAEITLTGITVLLLDLFLRNEEKRLLAWLSLIGLVVASAMALFLWGSQEGGFGDTILLDKFSLFFTLLFCGVAAMTILSSIHFFGDAAVRPGEFLALVLFSVLGMVLMAAANDLILFF